MATALSGYSIQRNEIFDIMHKHQKDVFWGNSQRNHFPLRTNPNILNGADPKWSVRIGDATKAQQIFQCTDVDGGIHYYTGTSCTAAAGTWNGSLVPTNKYEFIFSLEDLTPLDEGNPYGKIILGVYKGNVETTLQGSERLVARYTELEAYADGGLLFQLANDLTTNPYGLPDRFPGTADLNNANGQWNFYLSSTETNIVVKIVTIKDSNGDLLGSTTEVIIAKVVDGTAITTGQQDYIYHGVTSANLEPFIEFINLDELPSVHQEVVITYTPTFPKKDGFRLIYPTTTDEIENTFVVESYGADVLSDDVSIQASLQQPSGAGYSRQSWRLRFHYDYNKDELIVNVGTKYQILDNGNMTRVQERDGIRSEILRGPGELCDIYHLQQLGRAGSSDVNLDIQKGKSGFFRRVGKTTDDFSSTYPISYRLSVTDHGIGLVIWDQAAVEQEDDYAWLVVQRHVDNTTGEADWGDQVGNQSPVHCIYSPYKRPVDMNRMPAYYNTQDMNDSQKSGSIYNSYLGEYEANHSAVSSNYKFDGIHSAADLSGGNRVGQFDSEDGSPDSDRRTDKVTDSWGNIFIFLDGTDGVTYTIDYTTTAQDLDNRLILPSKGTETDITTDPVILGEYDVNVKPGATNRESVISSMIISLDGVEIERANDFASIRVSGGIHSPDWGDDQYNGTNGQVYIYDEEFHMIHFRTPPTAGAELLVKFHSYQTGSASSSYYIEIPKDPEMPNSDLNVNRNSKAIYRFVVREADVFKPWDIHKSATMHSIDSNAIMNPMEQLAITADRNFVFSFPTSITTQRFYYPTSELDMISYSSADFSTFGGKIEIDKYLDSNGQESIVYDSKYYDSSTGTFKKVNLATEAVIESGYSNITKSTYRYRLGRKRVYEGMMSTLPNGNGMRIFMHVNGSSIIDSDVPDGKFN